MRARLAVVALAAAVLFATAELRAQTPPRDIWPQAAGAAREGDLDAASKQTALLLTTGRNYGIRTYPVYAGAAAGLAWEAAKGADKDLTAWATKTAGQLDPSSPAVAFSNADRAASLNRWGEALPLALQGFGRVITNYRTNVLSRADFVIVAALALAITAIIFAIALFIRYGRSMAHDFREWLSQRFSGGSVTVLAFALLFLPLFLWLGPIWLLFYWFAIFFGYATPAERILIVILLLIVAMLPIALEASSNWVAGVDSPVVLAATSSQEQSYQPEALRRLQELVAVTPDNPMLHLLLGNLQAFEGSDEQAAVHYRRAIELRRGYAGAHVNLGNLHFLDNEFQAAMTEYERAQAADPKLAIAFYNASIAASEMYKYDLQAQLLEKARGLDRTHVERLTATPPAQKVVMYHPAIAEAWQVTKSLSRVPASRALFGNYSAFDPLRTAANPITIGAVLALLLGVFVWLRRRRSGYAGVCIKCGRTFCHRCKSSRESMTYCTQCIHIYLKRDGVSLDTKRKKLEEVTEHHTGTIRRNRAFATFLPGSAQLLEGRTTSGMIGLFFFTLFVCLAILVGRLAPALGPSAEVAQLLVRVVAILVAVVIWLSLSLPVYRRRSIS
jgi:tetratricopeptide (TPR) repeat protein